jgi:phage gp36-like protein
MAFLTKDELKTRSHIEIIDAITRNDDTIIDMIISESISYMKGYLNARYNVDSIFTALGADRDHVVLKMLKAIVIYEIYASHNPQMMTQTVKDNNDRAVKWLEKVQATDINPDLPLKKDDADEELLTAKFGSNTRRENHY